MAWTSAGESTLRARDELALLPDYSAALASEVPVTVRASSNEAPDGLSPAVREAVLARLGTVNRYPLMGGGDVATAIAAHLGAAPEEIAAADGSLSLLNYLLLTFCRPGQKVVFAWRSYEAYPICVRTAGAEPVPVPNLPDGAHDLRAMAAAVDADTAAVILCSPNNPTGTGLSHAQVEAFLAGVPRTVLVALDEAYLDFRTDADAPRSRELLARHPNLVLLRTFSKAYALAGLRVGYVVARPEVIRSVRKILPPFAVNALAAVAAEVALGEEERRRALVAQVVAQRVDVTELFDGYGLPYARSEANFVWLPLGEDSTVLGRECAVRGISTRVFDGEGIRISLGEPGLLPGLEAALEAFAGVRAVASALS